MTNVQTMRLSRGRHGSPDDGACVMELASMLAGEPFSDHCRGVCRVLGAFARGYNDAIDDRRRQDLIPYAARLVGSEAGREVAAARAQAARRLAREAVRSSRLHLPWSPLLPRDAVLAAEVAGAYVARLARRRPEWHARALAFLDEQLGEGLTADAAAQAPDPPAGGQTCLESLASGAGGPGRAGSPAS